VEVSGTAARANGGRVAKLVCMVVGGSVTGRRP
jgi:hypothetical protein